MSNAIEARHRRPYMRSLCLQFALLLCPPLLAHAAEPQRLTTDSLLKRDPVFVNQGQEIVYVLLERPEQLRMVRLNLADGTITPLHKDESRSELEPAFSRDGRYYAFIQSRAAASVGMVIKDAQTQQEVELPPEPGFSGMRSPTFSPDGKRVYYSFPEDDRQQIFSVDLKAGDRKKLIDTRGINNWPDFSPDGKQLTLSSTRDGNFEIYVHDADGAHPRRLTDCPFQDLRPRFSPDGRRIAFTSARDGNYEIYVINADGTGLQRITDHPERDDYPAWHPDSKRLAMVSERNGRFDLYLVTVPD